LDYCQSLTVAGRLHSAEAIATVHGLIPTGHEWNRGVFATLGANYWMHLSGSTVGVSVTSLALASPATLGTPLGFVRIPLGSEELLLASGKDKLGPAFHAGKGFV